MGSEPLGQARVAAVRAFFGLPLPEQHRAALEAHLRECAALAPQFRWTPAANLHLTVRFLGHVEQATAEAIADRLAAVDPGSFELELGEAGTFRRGRLASVLWIGLRSGQAGLGSLAQLAEEESRRAGLEPEARPYHAHLTLARARPREGAAVPPLPPPPALPAWHARELILYRSRLGRGGSVYEPLRSISLR